MPYGNNSTSSMAAYDFTEDDEDEEEEYEKLPTGAKGAADSWGKTATATTKVGNTVAQQALGRFGNVAQVANLAQTGNALHAAGTGVSAALAPVAAITGPIGIALALVESGFSAYSAVKTYGHIKNLEKILVDYGQTAKEGTREAIVFTCQKKNKKLKRKGLGCLPLLGSICNTVYTIGRTIQKKVRGDKGVDRRYYAHVLWFNNLAGDRCARKACEEILGLKIYLMIDGLKDGDLVLKKKMKSL